MTETAGTATRTGAGIWRAGGIAILAAVVVNVVIWAVGRAVVGDLTVEQQDTVTNVNALYVVGATVVNLLLGTLLLWALAKVNRGVMIWTVVAIVVGLLSLGQPFAAAEETSTAVVLGLMHLTTLGIALGVLRPAATT